MRTSQRLLVSAPGKVILFGEHAVVYGKTAVAASVELRTFGLFQVYDLSNHINGLAKIKFLLPDIGFEQSWSLNDLNQVIRTVRESNLFNIEPGINFQAIKNLAHDKFIEIAASIEQHVQNGHQNDVKHAHPATAFLLLIGVLSYNERAKDILHSQNTILEIAIRSTIPLGSGLGSSASYSVVIAEGLLALFNITESNRDVINAYAFLVEKVLHGNPSGVDNSICTFGGLLSYEDGVIHLLDKFEEQFLIVDTKVEKNTREQLDKVRKLYEQHPDITRPILDAIDKIAQTFITRPLPEAQSKTSLLETLLSMNHSLLQSLGVSHPTLDTVVRIAQRHGLAGKLTGGGGGGCAIVLVPAQFEESLLKTVEKECRTEGFQCYRARLGGDGVLTKSIACLNEVDAVPETLETFVKLELDVYNGKGLTLLWEDLCGVIGPPNERPRSS